MLMLTVPLNVALDIKPIRPRVCCVRTFVEFSEMPPWMAPGIAPLLTDTGVAAVIARIAGTALFELPGLSEWVIASCSVSSELSRPEFTSKLDILRCSFSLASPMYGINPFTLLCPDSPVIVSGAISASYSWLHMVRRTEWFVIRFVASKPACLAALLMIFARRFSPIGQSEYHLALGLRLKFGFIVSQKASVEPSNFAGRLLMCRLYSFTGHLRGSLGVSKSRGAKGRWCEEEPLRVFVRRSFHWRKPLPSLSRFCSTSPTRNCRASCRPLNPKPFVNKYHNPCNKLSGFSLPNAPVSHNLSSSSKLRRLARFGKFPLPRDFSSFFFRCCHLFRNIELFNVMTKSFQICLYRWQIRC